MKTNVFLVGIPELSNGFTEYVKANMPEVLIEFNFEQVFAMAKLGEINRLCILTDVMNISGTKYNYARGQAAAERLHTIDSSLPILVWEGREYDCPDDIHPMMQLYGTIHPVKYKNELYLNFKDYQPPALQPLIIQKFFEGTLSEQDVPKKECLNFCF